MQITECIKSRITEIKERPVLVGVCGRAGSGKSTIVGKLKDELAISGLESLTYSGDWRFKMDSKERKEFINRQWQEGQDAYFAAINQFNWWDFAKIYSDLEQLKKGQTVFIKDAYSRDTGRKDAVINFTARNCGVIFYENCVLGGLELLNKLNIIVFLNVPEKICFERILEKDQKRRSFPEILSRRLVTTYSENLFFKFLFDKVPRKILVCDSDGCLCGFPKIEEVTQIPTPLFKNTKTI